MVDILLKVFVEHNRYEKSNFLIDTCIYSANLVIVPANIVAHHDGRPSASKVGNTNVNTKRFLYNKSLTLIISARFPLTTWHDCIWLSLHFECQVTSVYCSSVCWHVIGLIGVTTASNGGMSSRWMISSVKVLLSRWFHIT